MSNRQYLKMEKKMLIYNLSHLPQLVFEVTDACNLKCKYCAFSDLYVGYDERKNRFLNIDYAKEAVDYLVNFWKENASPEFPQRFHVGFYGGEPLLNVPFIKEIIAYIESLGDISRNISYSMTTNGTLLNKYMDYLVKKDFSLLISFDGDESAQSLRVYHNGENSFKDVYNNVRLLQEQHPAFFEKKVSFNAVLHARNEIESVYTFFQTHFSKVPRISSLSDSGVNKDKLGDFGSICNEYTESFNRIPANTAKEIAESNLFMSPEFSSFYRSFEAESGNVFYNYHELLLNKQELGTFPTGACLPFSKKMFITVNGKILQCERIDHEHVLGWITDKGVELNLDKITDNHNNFIFRHIKQCTTCNAGARCPVCVYRIDDFQKTTSCPSFSQTKTQARYANLLRENPRLLEKVYEVKTIK